MRPSQTAPAPAQPGEIPHYDKSVQVRRLLERACHSHPLFNGLRTGSAAREQLISAFYPIDFEHRQVVIRQGDIGDWFAIVECGSFAAERVKKAKVQQWDKSEDDSDDDDIEMMDAKSRNSYGDATAIEKMYGPGESFGELALLCRPLRLSLNCVCTPAPCRKSIP